MLYVRKKNYSLFELWGVGKMRFIGVVLAWLTGFAGAGFVVWVTKIGPVICTISAEQGWGVHSGDAFALIPLAFSVIITVALLRKSQEVSPYVY